MVNIHDASFTRPSTRRGNKHASATLVEDGNSCSRHPPALLPPSSLIRLEAIEARRRPLPSERRRGTSGGRRTAGQIWLERNANAINCRYTLINKETARFCGCLQQILNREENGRTIEEKTNDAHIMFKEMDLKKKKPFILMHYYVELSKYPKWQAKELETSRKKQKKTVGASPGTSTNDLADASTIRTDATSIHRDALEHEQRPDGVKKDKLRKGKADDSACKLSLETVWAAKQEKDDIKEAAKNARYAQQFELRKEEIALKKKEDARNEREDARRQFELDERVMLIDTSGMTYMQKQFYQTKQNEILARRLE
ncbi:uncharacterized protein LOC123405512 [Hordeum vulgare subsp. vulgare]|uniref:uncharacterized protein LOC123405512 n=1 Tax=Hordeum vulgare subsp. vulgare TaxID=112509 RepID=UPI001D1A380A|nr:uncharacterized protein LOC123405512 [Hordeum vulgare subsp. vulgare]